MRQGLYPVDAPLRQPSADCNYQVQSVFAERAQKWQQLVDEFQTLGQRFFVDRLTHVLQSQIERDFRHGQGEPERLPFYTQRG